MYEKKEKVDPKTTDFKIALQEQMKSRLKGTHYLERLPGRTAFRARIIPMLRICEVRLITCNDLAYRKVHSRFGNKWTCDSCAKELCIESDFYILANLSWRI